MCVCLSVCGCKDKSLCVGVCVRCPNEVRKGEAGGHYVSVILLLAHTVHGVTCLWPQHFSEGEVCGLKVLATNREVHGVTAMSTPLSKV